MLSVIRQLFVSRNANSSEREKALLRAKLIAVAVMRTTNYAEFAR